jgi:cadherin-like protein
VVGDRFTDPNWFGVNVNAQTFLPAPPDQIASLTMIAVKGAALMERFTASTHEYPVIVSGGTHGPITIAIRPASSRVQSLTIGGKAVKSGAPYKVSFNGQPKTVPIVVTARDGQTTDTYRLTFARDAR